MAAAPFLAPPPAPSPTTRQLRPRRAAGPPGTLAVGATAPPRTSGRITRSLTLRSKTCAPTNQTAALSSHHHHHHHAHVPPPDSPDLPHQAAAAQSSSSRSRKAVVAKTAAPSHKRPARSAPLAATRRSKRQRPQSGFYVEDSDSGVESDDPIASGPESDLLPVPISPRQRQVKTRAAAGRVEKPTAPPKKGLGVVPSPTGSTHKKSKRASDLVATASAQPDARIPPWDQLPWFVWANIFRHVYEGLDERNGINWLLSASRICTAFTEPALKVLYHSPALLTRPMAHNLVALVAKDPSTTTFNYRAMIKKLLFDVDEIVSKTHKGQHLDLKTLITHLPRLQVIGFNHVKDAAPFRLLDDNLRWHYPEAVFEALNHASSQALDEGNHIRRAQLAGWTWNRRMMGPNMTIDSIRAIHLTPPFRRLKKLCMTNFQVPSLNATGVRDEKVLDALDASYIQHVALAISALPELEVLSIQSSTVVNSEFLSLLPRTLRTLELINCWDIGGEDFAGYLLSHGRELEHLHLDYNQSLNLSFLAVLHWACPNLKTLSIDLKTYNHHEFYRDAEPNYDDVLTPDQTPTWPQSIESIEIKNIRKWTAEAAEVFFSSLVDNAQALPNLRCLDLKTMLNIPFRQRSELRDKWHARLKKVFLKENKDPMPLYSLRSNEAPQDEPPEKPAAKPAKPGRKPRRSFDLPPPSPSRRSSRLAASRQSNASSRASSVELSEWKANNVMNRISYLEPDTDDDMDFDQSDDEEDQKSKQSKSQPATPAGSDGEVLWRQGLCDRVEIQLDNQKPRENTWVMEDFLDDDASDDPSDGDWDGNDAIDDDGGYAW